MCVLAVQSHPAFCDPMDCSLPGSSVHGILQARIVECSQWCDSNRSFWPSTVDSIAGRWRGPWLRDHGKKKKKEKKKRKKKKNSGMGCHLLRQGIFQTWVGSFSTQGLNSGLLHCRQILYCLSFCAINRMAEFSSCSRDLRANVLFTKKNYKPQIKWLRE